MTEDVEYPPNCMPIPCSSGNSELVKRLKILSEALQESDTNDESGHPDRYRTLLTHLAKSCFLETKSKDVQIWLACCLADILRVFAPNVPLGDPSQLRDILVFIVRALKGLESPSNPLFRRYFYLLENLSVVSTLVLAVDLPAEDVTQVIRTLLKTSMEVANGKEWRSEMHASEDGSVTEDDGDERSESRDKVIGLLIGMISKLLRDVDQVSAEVLDVLFFYLINPQKLNNRESYSMSRQIIQVSQTSLEAMIQSLLTQSLLAGSFPKECELVGSGRKKLHDVILELHEVAPELVTPVLPQLSTSLRAEDDGQRLLATKLVGRLAASGTSRFFDEHPKLWKSYIERFKDTSSEIRNVCAKDSHEILLRHSQLRGQISSALGSLTRDLDDGVRLTAVLCIIETARKKLEAVNESLILACCDRMKDKKPKIRQEAITKLLYLYYKVIMGDEYTASEISAIAVIPKKALTLYMLASMTEEKLMIERYFSSYIIPYKMEIKKRIKLMVDLFCKLDNFEAQVFAEVVSRSSSHRRILREMLQIISRQAAIELQAKIQRICSTHPDPAGFSIALKHFANLLSTDQRCFECAEYLVSNEYTASKIEETSRELIQRSLEANIPKDCQTHIRRYLERVAPLIMDLDSAAELLNVLVRTKNDADCGNVDAMSKLPNMLRLVKIWSEAFPHIFSRNDAINSVLKIVVSDDVHSVETGLQVLLHVAMQSSLKAKEQDWCESVVKVVWDLITSENDGFGRCCKLATRVICRLLGKEESTTRFDELYPVIEYHVSNTNPAACVNALQVIAELHRNLPRIFVVRVKRLIAEYVVPGLILSYETDPEDVDCFDPFTPLEDQAIPKYCMSKIYGMKLLARYLFTCGGDADDDSLAMKTLKMFVAFVQAAGDLHDLDKKISATEKAWLRVVAGTSLLKLCYIRKYSHMMNADMFVAFSNLMKDDADCVRGHFVRRLNKGITRNRLTIEYLSFFSLVALLDGTTKEEEKAINIYREQCRTSLLAAISRRRSLVQSSSFVSAYLPYHQPEYAIAYAIWLLSHQDILSAHTDIAHMAVLQDLLDWCGCFLEDRALRERRSIAVDRYRLILPKGLMRMSIFSSKDNFWTLFQLVKHPSYDFRCLWYIMEPFIAKKESTDFEFIHRLLQDVKESSDALFAQRQKDGEIGEAEVVGQSKKMWALADLGMLMLLHRGKIASRNEPRKTILSPRFFKKETNSKHAGEVHAPHELIENEKERNGRIPSRERKNSNVLTNTATLRRAGREKKYTLKKSRVRVPSVSLRKVDELPLSSVEISPARKKTNRKQLKMDEESAMVIKEERILNLSSISSQGSPGRRISTRNRKTADDHGIMTNNAVEIEDESASPSTSGEQIHTRSLRNQKVQRLSPTSKSATPSKRSLKTNTSPLKRNSNNETNTHPSQNGDSEVSSPLPKKRQRSDLGTNNDVIDFSPILRSGKKITRGKTSHVGPLSTSTPVPKSTSKSPKRNKSLKEIKAEMVKLPEKKVLKEGKEKVPTNVSKTRTRPQRSILSNGSISSTSPQTSQRSDSKAKISSSPAKPQTRPKRTHKTRGKAK